MNSKSFQYILFYKPYGVLCQFTGEEGDRTLADFGLPKEVYAAGRLDKDSEGLLLLTNDGPFINKVAHPKFNKTKTYWVQVEGLVDSDKLDAFSQGPLIKGGKTKPCKVREMDDPGLAQRDPPIRYRKTIPTSWLEVELSEGKNRQVRRMCAAVGLPCLRLIRVAIGKADLKSLKEGEWREVKRSDVL